VIAPALYLLTKADAENLSTFVHRGGTLLATYFSGIVDEHEHIVLGGYPAWLRSVLGLWVEEWAPYAEGQTNLVRFAGSRGAVAKAGHWCDVVHLEGAKALATYTGDYFAGRAAVTVHAHGEGQSYYLGTKLEGAGLDRVLDAVCATAKVEPVLATPEGVEATLREKDGAAFLFLLNHCDEAMRVKLGRHRGRDLLSQAKVARTVHLPPRGVVVVALE
jgi:beta-galactosidase